jgi:hypothetical protein
MSSKHHIARRLAPTAVGALCALAALAPGAANAGTYQMYNCHVAGHETGTVGPWVYKTAVGAPSGYLVNGCSNGSGWGYSFGPYFPDAIAGNSRVDLALEKDNSNISMGLTKLYFRAHTRAVPGYEANPLTATVWKDGVKYIEWKGGPEPDYRSAPLEFTPTKSVTLSAGCTTAPGCAPFVPVTFEVAGVQADLSESITPGAAITGGTLTAGGAQAGTKTVTVEGTDPDSGVRKLEVLLDDVIVAKVDYDRDWTKPLSDQKAGTCAFDTWRACAAARTVDLSVDTRDLADGAYALIARVTDAAGNVRTVQAAQPVSIDNVPDPIAPRAPDPIPGVPGRGGADGPAGPTGADGANGRNGAVLTVNGVNGTPNATVRAAFASTKRGTIKSAYGKKVLITGRLIAPNGQPIAGARVTVMLQDKMVGAKLIPAGEVVTDKDGNFRYVTTAVRSRTVRFGYRAHLQDADFAQTTDISLGVIAKLALRTNKRSLRNGQTVRFSGSVAGAPSNARKVVELQVRKASGWMTFRSTRLRNGRFSEKYRFTATRGRRTYVFRARVRQEAGFPFLTGVSKQVRVTVRG